MDNMTKVFREVLQDGTRVVVLPVKDIPKKYWNYYNKAWSVTVMPNRHTGKLEIKSVLPGWSVAIGDIGGIHKDFIARSDFKDCWACIPESFWEPERNELWEYSL